jgi:hypothetical protein
LTISQVCFSSFCFYVKSSYHHTKIIDSVGADRTRFRPKITDTNSTQSSIPPISHCNHRFLSSQICQPMSCVLAPRRVANIRADTPHNLVYLCIDMVRVACQFFFSLILGSGRSRIPRQSSLLSVCYFVSTRSSFSIWGWMSSLATSELTALHTWPSKHIRRTGAALLASHIACIMFREVSLELHRARKTPAF